MRSNPNTSDANGVASNGLLKRIGKWYFKDDYRNNPTHQNVDTTPTMKASLPMSSPVTGSTSAAETYHPLK